MSNIVIVLGMHRSGTSLVSGLLHNNGIVMGTSDTFYPLANEENKKGFYENHEFRKINDYILEKNGYRIKSWETNLPTLKSSFIANRKIKHIIKRYSKLYATWGWKDPRQMLTNEYWLSNISKLNLLNKTKILYIFRHPLSVAKSMVSRGNFSEISHGLSLWYMYNVKAISDLNKYNLDTLFFSMESLQENSNYVLGNISCFLDIEINLEDFYKYYSHKLIRSSLNNDTTYLESNISSMYSYLFDRHS